VKSILGRVSRLEQRLVPSGLIVHPVVVALLSITNLH
jgi:hypothetical protein